MKRLAPLPRAFYARDAETVARALLGTVLVHRKNGAELCARIVETEAYVGPHDLACHASRGRTRRTEVMFGEAGHAYVYLIYGMYRMLNVVTGEEGDPQAVLVRAAEPVSGVVGTTNGPGRLARAMSIEMADNGVDLCAEALFFARGARPRAIVETTRVNVDYAGEWAEKPLRFYDPASRWVSRK